MGVFFTMFMGNEFELGPNKSCELQIGSQEICLFDKFILHEQSKKGMYIYNDPKEDSKTLVFISTLYQHT